MGLVKHSTSENWYFRFNLNGRTYFGSTKTTNKALAAKVERAKYDEVLKQNELGDKKKCSIKEAFALYLRTQESNGEYRNVQTYMSKLLGKKMDKRGNEVSICGFDGDKAFHTLKDEDIQRLVMERKNEGNADATILLELINLSKCVRIVSKLGYQTPTIDLKSLKKENQLRPVKTKLRYLTLDEEKRLLQALDPSSVLNAEIRDERSDMRDLVLILLDTGARYSEISTLPWASVDMEKSTIHIYREKVKNQSVLFMTERMKEVFTRRLASKRENQLFVFENSSKDGPRNYAPKAFNDAVKRAGLENVTLHTLRKTLASRLVQSGITTQAVAQILGHTSTKVTEATYAFLAPNQSSQAAVEVLNKLNQ
jgi:integrase